MTYFNHNKLPLASGSSHSIDDNFKLLKQLHLSGMADALVDISSSKEFIELGFNDQLYELLYHEVVKRMNTRYQSRLKKAQLHSSATQEVIIDRKASYNLSRNQIEYMMSCNWITEGELILITGKCGCGKTDLASAIVDSACRKGLKAKCIDYSLCILDLLSAQQTGSPEIYEKRKSSYASNQLLLLDDICIGSAKDGESFVFKELVQLCRENNRCGLILVSQLKPSKWMSLMGGSKEAADAVIDRISSKCLHINLEGNSHRASRRKHNAPEVSDEQK